MSLLNLVDDIKKEIKNNSVEKREEYMAYIDEHKKNVVRAYLLFSNSGITEYTEDMSKIRENIYNHDESKYSDEEFEPYRMKFFPINDEEKEEAEELFDKAWEHHYMVNPHHWNHWVDKNGVAQEMPIIYIIEMICDWQAMSFKFGGDCESWYYNEKSKNAINLHPNTREIVESLLKKYVESLRNNGTIA